MTDATKTVVVTIMEREYRIACPAGAEPRLLQAARSLDQKRKEIRASGKVLGVERIAIMAALNFTHDLLALSGSSDQMHDSVQRMHDKIDRVLIDSRES